MLQCINVCVKWVLLYDIFSLQTLRQLHNATLTLSRPASNGQTPIEKSDPEVEGIIRKEKFRQTNGLELIASEVGSVFFTIILRGKKLQHNRQQIHVLVS